MLKKYGKTCPVMLSSSQQASLTGRFGNSEYEVSGEQNGFREMLVTDERIASSTNTGFYTS